MKYPKIMEALDMIFYLIGKRRLSHWETQKTATNSGILRNSGNCKRHLSKMSFSAG